MTGEQLKTLRNNKGWTQEELARQAGVSKRTIINYESSDEIPKAKANYLHFLFLDTPDEDEKVTLTFELPVDENENNKVEDPEPETYTPEGRIIERDNYPKKTVHVIPIKGRGGLENAFFDEVKFKDLEKEILTIKEPSSNGSKWFKIEVEGVSMDDGSKRSLAEGDWAYCRSIGKQYWKSKFHAHKYDIFCFFHNERGIIFKKIKDQNVETGELLLESLHPDKKKYPDFTIKVSECSYICNVIKVLSEF